MADGGGRGAEAQSSAGTPGTHRAHSHAGRDSSQRSQLERSAARHRYVSTPRARRRPELERIAARYVGLKDPAWRLRRSTAISRPRRGVSPLSRLWFAAMARA